VPNPNPVAIYYWLTPAFWALDVFFGANLRTAALEGQPGWKAAYYLFCIGCGVALWLKPAWTSVVGFTESSVNVTVLILGFFVPYFQLIDRLAAGESAFDASPFTVEKAVSLLLSGVVCALAFQRQVGGARLEDR
jgi:hypothetical protein